MTCDYCGEEMESDVLGQVVGMVRDAVQHDDILNCHRECTVRMFRGSLGHQLGICSCPGKPGIMDDPPGLTRREAARAAAAFFQHGNPQ